MSFKRSLLAGAFVAALGIGGYVSLVHSTLRQNRELAQNAEAIVRRDGMINIVGNDDRLDLFHSLENGNVSIYSNNNGLEVKITQILMTGDSPCIRVLDLIDWKGNGTIDEVQEDLFYFTEEGVVPQRRKISYIGVDYIPFHENQGEYLGILRLLEKRKLKELKKLYEHQIPKKKELPPGIYEV